MTTATRDPRWTIYAALPGIILDGEALACNLATGGTIAVVRATTSGEFAVIRVNGSWAKVAGTFPTLDRARA